MAKRDVRQLLKQKGTTLRIEPVTVPDRPEFDGQLFVRTITSKQFGIFESRISSIDSEGTVTMDRREAREALLVFALCDEKGERVFEDDELHEIGALDPPVVTACFLKAADLNGISKKAKAALKKDSAPAQDGGSPSV